MSSKRGAVQQTRLEQICDEADEDAAKFAEQTNKWLDFAGEAAGTVESWSTQATDQVMAYLQTAYDKSSDSLRVSARLGLALRVAATICTNQTRINIAQYLIQYSKTFKQ